VDIYPTIYRGLRLLWSGGLETRQHLRELERTQWLSQEELEEYQLAKLQRLVAHAYEKVPFYRERYSQAGIQPRDIKTLKDFEALPFLTRHDIRENAGRMVTEGVPLHKLFPVETSGSTGEPIQFYVEGSFWWWNAANVFRGRQWHGVRDGDKIALFWGAQIDLPSWSLRNRLRAALSRQRYLNAFTMSKATMQEFAEMLIGWQPAMLKAYPSSLYLFARSLKEWGVKDIRPRFIETTSEKLSLHQRELLEDVFGCPAGDQYSSRELGTIAYPCENTSLHTSADLRYVEIIAKDQPVQPGQMGELVVTSFDQYAMPFIRYKKQDIAVWEPRPCSCGRSFPRLQEIVGRTGECLVTSTGEYVSSHYFEYLFRARPEIIRYQVHQRDREHMDIQLVSEVPMSTDWLREARQKICERFGQQTQLDIQLVEDIPLTRAGKHRHIYSDLDPDFI
jgi:phenylacetate-CoA ligase